VFSTRGIVTLLWNWFLAIGKRQLSVIESRLSMAHCVHLKAASKPDRTYAVQRTTGQAARPAELRRLARIIRECEEI
jgi:hypothetical protein